MDLSMGLIRADILMAKQGIELFKERKIKEIKNTVAYHIQQAAEKLIKIQIYRSGVPYSNSALYIHNLSKLISYAESIGVELILPDEIRENALMITDWESGSGYDLQFVVRIDTLEKYQKIVDEWFSELKIHGIGRS